MILYKIQKNSTHSLFQQELEKGEQLVSMMPAIKKPMI